MSESAQWFDALAGSAPADPAEAAEVAAIQQAARQMSATAVDELALRRLRTRLQAEGLLLAPSRTPSWSRGLARVAVAVLCLGVVVEIGQIEPPTSSGLPPPLAEPAGAREDASEEVADTPSRAPAPPAAKELALRDRQEKREAEGAAASFGAAKSAAEKPRESRALRGEAPPIARQSPQSLAPLLIKHPDPESLRADLAALVKQQPELLLLQRPHDSAELRCDTEPVCRQLNDLIGPWTTDRLQIHQPRVLDIQPLSP